MLKNAGSKPISIDGQRFRYVISDATPTRDDDHLALTAQHATRNGSRLHIPNLPAKRVPESQSKFYRGRTLERPIAPRQVEHLIRQALSQGWLPTKPGKPFLLTPLDFPFQTSPLPTPQNA